jgi:transketolase
MHPNLVALDADLILDTGLIPFREKFPRRFFECGIAEQDMVSMAGGMALKGLLPIVHSFACFLSARPNEQIYNNATEMTKIIYVGSLAGVLPGGPGHSHQAVRDISALAAMPGMTLVEPCCEEEVGLLLDWCIHQAAGSCYLRLVSLPWSLPYALPQGYAPKVGQGVTLVDGSEIALIAYGPVLLSAAVEAVAMITRDQGRSVKVINLPWLNTVDGAWLKEALGTCKSLICLENHYISGGQSDYIAKALAAENLTGLKVRTHGVMGIPPSGTNQEVLKQLRLDPSGIAAIVADL